jgi:hypothetical protein
MQIIRQSAAAKARQGIFHDFFMLFKRPFNSPAKRDEYTNKNIAYTVSIEKQLLATIFGDNNSKNEPLEIARASGIIHESDKSRKLLIINRGEVLLPILLQKKLVQASNIQLPLRSYYVQAEINDSYMQLNLYQVAELSTDKKEVASAITTKEKIIYFQNNMHDALCQNLWSHIQSVNGFISTHNYKRYNHEEVCDHILTLQDYELFSDTLMDYLVIS